MSLSQALKLHGAPLEVKNQTRNKEGKLQKQNKLLGSLINALKKLAVKNKIKN